MLMMKWFLENRQPIVFKTYDEISKKRQPITIKYDDVVSKNRQKGKKPIQRVSFLCQSLKETVRELTVKCIVKGKKTIQRVSFLC